MKLSIILVFLTFALTIDAGPPGLYLKPAGPPGLYLKPIDGRQQLEQTRGGKYIAFLFICLSISLTALQIF